MAQLGDHVGVYHLQRGRRAGTVLVGQGPEEAEGSRGGAGRYIEDADGDVEDFEAGDECR